MVYQAIGELCNTKLTEIKHTGLEKYYVLDRVLESVALFMTYIQFVEATLDFAGTDNFEDRSPGSLPFEATFNRCISKDLFDEPSDDDE